LASFFTLLATQSVERDFLAVIIGLCVGSFLNVLALRTLAEKPFWTILIGNSACPKCEHKLGPLDLIPVLSYIVLAGKCKYCKQRISWSYPVVEIITAITFVVVLHHYQVGPVSYGTDDVVRAVVLDLSMLVFFGILIAVCVTDFKEKLIPHEITYPSIMIGIAFSAWARQDLMPTLAGIGISYILFDFLAFYGLKMYYLLHKDDEGAKLLDHAVRAVDGDTLATIPIAKIAALEYLEHPHKLVASKQEKQENLEKHKEEEKHERAVALHQFEEAAVRSAMFAEAEDAVPDRVIVLTEPDEAPQKALLTGREEGTAELISEPNSTGETADFVASEPVHNVAPETADLAPQPQKLVEYALNGEDTQHALSLALESEFYDPEIDEAFGLTPSPILATSGVEESEDFEVMGGGDAVLAALIAAWLGLENLGVTLVCGFMFGSLMGSVYLAHELHKRGTLNKALGSTGLITAILMAISEGTIYLFASNTGMTAPGHESELRQLPWIALGVASIFGGILLGTITNGREGSKPFPFGPALAAGAVVAVFVDPLHKMIISEECIRFGTFLLDMGHN
jgi:prepilin signal peptidase PulO-like enzyme (type II secretory pathway)